MKQQLVPVRDGYTSCTLDGTAKRANACFVVTSKRYRSDRSTPFKPAETIQVSSHIKIADIRHTESKEDEESETKN